MPASVRPPNSPSAPPDANLVMAAVARLRAEHDAQENATQRAVLLHEIGVLEELLGDESSAARDQLAAVNADAEFREPLERLIAIIERRQSYKNLGKLLERLQAVADTPEERSRASLERSGFLTREDDLDGAREAAEQAVAERPEDPLGWLWLEVVGAKLGDAALRSKALAARTERATHGHWRALLLIDLARDRIAAENSEGALEALQAASADDTPARFEALSELEGAAQAAGRTDDWVGALDAQARLIAEAAQADGVAATDAVPRYLRKAVHAADRWLRAAQGERMRGRVDSARQLLERALEVLPGDPALMRALLQVAQATGDTETAARLSRAGLERGAKGSLAAALWLRVAEHAAASGDGAAALEAVKNALREDPGSIPGRSLQLDLLAGSHEHAALASALEAAAEQLPSDAAKVRFFVLAADQWARVAGDVQGAKAALSQASLYGARPALLGRVARTLAAIAGDVAWYEEATRRLATAGAENGEATALAFEIARSRLLRADPNAAAALDALSATPAGGRLAHTLRAYALSLTRSDWWNEDAAAGLSGLAAEATDPDAALGFRLAEAVRALLRGDAGRAQALLGEIHAANPTDLVTTSALSRLLAVRGERVEAARVLRASAGRIQDDAVADAFLFEAGFTFWQSGDRPTALSAFSDAAERAPAGASVLRWALRAADPEAASGRRRALEAAGDDERRATALERFALEAGRDGDVDAARAALDLPAGEDDALGRALALARVLWGAPAQPESLDEIAGWGPQASALAHGAEHLITLAINPSGALETASRWAAAEATPVAALEWLGAAFAHRDTDSEVLARNKLASTLTGAAAVALESSAALVHMLAAGEPGPLLESKDPTARLANFELALPGSDPRRRARALADARNVFGDEAGALAGVMIAYNLLALGDIERAARAFRMIVDAQPEDIAAWEGLRAAAERAGDRATMAEACAALGDRVADDARGAELWESAAFIFIEELGEAQRGELALSRAVERDIRRAAAFDKLFRLVRSRKDNARLIELIAARLEVAEDSEEIAKLFWERARALREAGDRSGALQALENVTMLEPDHVGALALSGEIYITKGRFADAATALARLAELDAAPTKQRLMSGVAAVDLYDNKLGEVGKALAVLVGLHRSGLSTLPVRERLARTAAKAEAWQQATEVLEQLMHERQTREGRIEAARLAMAIHRDRLGRPEQAARAVIKLLEEQRDDAEALELVLSGVLPEADTRPLLERARAELVRSLSDEPLDIERIERLSRIAQGLRNPALRQATLGALIALGIQSPVLERELSGLDERFAHLPQAPLDSAMLAELCDPDDRGPFQDLVRVLAPTFAEALGRQVAALGVGRKDKVDARAGTPLRNEIAAWASAFGINEFDLYVGGPDAQAVHAVATERPAIVVGRSVGAPLSPAQRQLVVRELFALKRGTSLLVRRDPAEVLAVLAAVCRLGGLELPVPAHPGSADIEHRLQKELPRKVKKQLPELVRPAASQDPLGWARAAVASLDRVALIAAADASWVLSDGDARLRGRLGATVDAQERARRLLTFSLSFHYLELRERLGMGVT